MPDTVNIWNFVNHSIDCSRPIIMGIINTTPDSFSDGGQFLEPDVAIEQAVRMVDEGVDILDIGGESTRPGSDAVPVDEELNRVIPVIEGIRDAGIAIPISIDTRRLEVAEPAVESGAVIVNDVSGLRDSPYMADFIAEKNLGIVIMHMLGRPRSMQVSPGYEDVINEIGQFFGDQIDFAESRGIPHENIALDPGIGFGKHLEHNLTILRDCSEWLKYHRPLVIGPSRKRFIGEILDNDVTDRLNGTIGACVASMLYGGRIFRVHDVRPVREALEVAYRIMGVKTEHNA